MVEFYSIVDVNLQKIKKQKKINSNLQRKQLFRKIQIEENQLGHMVWSPMLNSSLSSLHHSSLYIYPISHVYNRTHNFLRTHKTGEQKIEREPSLLSWPDKE